MCPDTSGGLEDLMPEAFENLKVGCRASRGTNPSNFQILRIFLTFIPIFRDFN